MNLLYHPQRWSLPLTKLLISQEYQLKQKQRGRWVKLLMLRSHTHTLHYLLYRRNIRAYTAPPMHSGYRRYDRYFMAYREMYKTHYSTTTKGHCVSSNNSLVLNEKKLTSVSYSSVLRSDSSDFPYCLQKMQKSQQR